MDQITSVIQNKENIINIEIALAISNIKSIVICVIIDIMTEKLVLNQYL